MSLRAFHVVFVAASIGLTLLTAVWGGVTWGSDRGTGWHLVAAAGSLAGAGLLSVYAVRFVRKTREIGLR